MKRKNMSLTIDFESRQKYENLLSDCTNFLLLVITYIQNIGFELVHKPGCVGGFDLTRHCFYERKRLGGLIICRIKCRHCGQTYSVLPAFVLRYSSLSPVQTSKGLTLAHGGTSLDVISQVEDNSGLALYSFICALGRHGIVQFLVNCFLALPDILIADEKHSKCRGEKVYLPTLAMGRVIWHIGCCEDKSEETFAVEYNEFKESAKKQDSGYSLKKALCDGFQSTINSLKRVFGAISIGNCIMHASMRIRDKLPGTDKETKQECSKSFFQLFKSLGNNLPKVRLGQRLRRLSEKLTKDLGEKADKAKQWIQEKKEGWMCTVSDDDIPKTTTYVDQAHNFFDRKLFMMKNFHHRNGRKKQFIQGMAVLYNMHPYQRRAKNAGKNGIQVEGGILPKPENWMLSLQILFSGGYRAKQNFST